MDSRVRSLLQEQLATGFADVEGARVSASLPVSERLLNEAIARMLPRSGRVSQVIVRPRAGNTFDVQLKLTRPAFLPTINITAVVERQPELPQSPVLILRLSSLPGLISAAGFGASFFNVLPPGMSMQGDRVFVDMRVMLEQHGLALILPLLERIAVGTSDGRVLLEVVLRVPAR